jgi:hypothetical protein
MIYHQIADVSLHGACRHHNMARVVGHGCFLLFVESQGWIPVQGSRDQMDSPKDITVPFVKGWSPHNK